EFRVQVQALARLNRHFFLAFAWHKVAPWPSVYASHTKIRIGSAFGVATVLAILFYVAPYALPASGLMRQ
ncbi:hypothetical protein LGM75_14375, partial [Burkholderia multivorans]|nr:hypothetical protein [Burkholderia multivorans]MCA8127533.1 hypothetical protein [Burkholderia multivorans]